jgi:uncharacterized protein
MTLKHKSSPVEETGAALALDVKALQDDGTFEGYGSVFGNTDLGGDVVVKGAFAESIGKRGARGVKMLWQHDSSQPIGVFTEVSEDGKGLKLKGRFLLNLLKSQEAYTLVKEGVVDGLSIGFKTMKDRWDTAKGIRYIEKADLREVSLVTFPMNPKAVVTAVKALPTERELEAMLRDEAGLSNRDARAAVAVMKKALRDGGETAREPRDEAQNEAMTRALAGSLDELLARLRS